MCLTWGHLLGPEQHLSEPRNGLVSADTVTLEPRNGLVNADTVTLVSFGLQLRTVCGRLTSPLSIREERLRGVPQFTCSSEHCSLVAWVS